MIQIALQLCFLITYMRSGITRCVFVHVYVCMCVLRCMCGCVGMHACGGGGACMCMCICPSTSPSPAPPAPPSSPSPPPPPKQTRLWKIPPVSQASGQHTTPALTVPFTKNTSPYSASPTSPSSPITATVASSYSPMWSFSVPVYLTKFNNDTMPYTNQPQNPPNHRNHQQKHPKHPSMRWTSRHWHHVWVCGMTIFSPESGLHQGMRAHCVITCGH